MREEIDVPVSALTSDTEAARRIAFVMARAADLLKLPFPCIAETLLQVAMEQPEAVMPAEYAVVYAMRSQEAAI